MNFKTFIQKLTEEVSKRTPGTLEANKKEKAKSDAPNIRAKDAARKRAERSREIPRERKSKQELVQEVIIVKTSTGRVQLIFKDSFNKNTHQKLSKDSLSMEEAKQITKDPKFEQTRASKLLFGDVKTKPSSEKKQSKKEQEETPKQKKSDKKPEAKEEKSEEKPKPKAKRLSKDEIFQNMSMMTGQQLAGMPLETRQEYFKMTRKPPSNTDFDNMTYEALTVRFGLSPISSLPYNQQVLNALMFLAKIKSGATDQELQTYSAVAPSAMEFTRTAFYTARKILSQLGEECIQNIVSNVETGTKPVNAEGAVDMQCGNYKFKVSAGGEMTLSTNEFDQSNKSFRGMIASALVQALSDPKMMQSDPKTMEAFQKADSAKQQFSTMLIPDEMLSTILTDKNLTNEFSKMKFTNAQGQDIGPAIDENGQLNPLLSLSNYRKGWEELTKSFVGGNKSTAKSALKSSMVSSILKTYLRGDNVVPPEMAPTHLVTINGVFPMSDEYFSVVSQQADVDMKPAKDVINSSNISRYKPAAAETLRKFRTIVEAKESLESLLVPIDSLNPMEFVAQYAANNNDFMMNVSLLPGFGTKDLNSVEFNYLKIGKKTIKIPVINDERISDEFISESAVIINEALLEALTNNFVLTALQASTLLQDSEASLFEYDSSLLLEGIEDTYPLKAIYHTVLDRVNEDPYRLFEFLCFVDEEYKRNYKKEYRNYHGKPKQRKERAARTAARELLIKKGRVRKGDGKDVDHKKPLRNGGSKSINNLRVRDKSENRSDNGHKKGEKQNKDWK